MKSVLKVHTTPVTIQLKKELLLHGVVRHGAMITRQAPAALARAFEELSADPEMPERVRDLGSLAADALGRMKS